MEMYNPPSSTININARHRNIDELNRFRQLAIDDLEKYIEEENHWQDKFDKKRTFGEYLADAVAVLGGSWYFVSVLFTFIITWAVLNKCLPEEHQWDPYPFILLNLFLSIIAACQAPIIMMSQNRIDAKDRSQRAYIDRFVLRSEKQICHVNEKLDFILDNLFHHSYHHFHQKSSTLVTMDKKERKQDPHLNYLLHLSHNDRHEQLDHLVFTHWNKLGDNFYGYVKNVIINENYITYDIEFDTENVFLDDILSGDYTLRNDLDLDYMNYDGYFENLKVTFLDGDVTTDIPPHYKASFSINRQDKVNDFWKLSIKKITIDYFY